MTASGSRPSRLELDARFVGERHGPVPAHHQAEIDAARQVVPPLDIVALRARAAELSPRAQVVPLRRRPSAWASVLGATLALAATLLLWVQPTPSTVERIKGEALPPQLGWMVLHDGEVQLGDAGTPVEAGDQLQFTWAGDAHTIVLMGIDGTGSLTVHWPEHGDRPVPLDPDGSELLDGSLLLDDAPGPEAFVAVFDAPSVSEARGRVAGVPIEALPAHFNHQDDVAVIVLTKTIP